jgi:peptide/nickel transport system substrate-binding protein
MLGSKRKIFVPALGALAVAATLAACGSNGSTKASSGSGGVNKNATIVYGTTDTVNLLDPAYNYDLGGQTVVSNIFQNLLKVPAGQTVPVGDAAQSCDFTADTTYACTLRDGLKFSNGDTLDAAAVVYSFKRMVGINDPNGPASLLAAMKDVTADGTNKVVFTLNQHDNTWPYVLTTLAAPIVDPKVFPMKTRVPDAKVIGSGPYKIESIQPKVQIVFVKNPNYTGDDQLQNSRFIMKFEQSGSTLKLDVEQGNVDVGFRGLSPTDITSLKSESSRGVKVVEGDGAEIRYIVFTTNKGKGKDKAVRQAVAYLLDRQDIAQNVYNGQVKPLYSMVADGLTGHKDVYKDVYGDSPSKDKAAKVLSDAGIQTPVKITAWYTPSHYGPVSADEWTTVRRQLNGSGLFDISLKSQEWDQYKPSYVKGVFDMYQLGWFPDYTDPDDYLAPFYPKGGFFNNHYDNPALDALVTKEKAEANKDSRVQEIEQAQQLGAQDAPTVPIWQSKQFAAVRSNVVGFEKTLDAAYIIRFWMVGKS